MLSSLAVPRRPLDAEVTRARRRRDRLAAQLAAEDAALEALLRAQRELLEAVGEYQRLHVHSPSVNTRSEQMQLENRIAISKGRSAASEDPFFATIRAAKPKGFTLRSLAKRIGSQASLLSMQRKGDRPIPRARAEEIAKLTGWPADAKHWPGGLS
jgi:hypothetical protein